MRCVWSCENPPGPDVLAVTLDVRLAPWGGLFLRSLRQAALEEGCALILLCKGGPEFTSRVAAENGFHYVVDCGAMGEGDCPVIAQLCRGVAVAGSVEALEMLWCVKMGIIFNPTALPVDALFHGSAASASRIEEVRKTLKTFVVTRVFRDGPALLNAVDLDQVLPAPLTASVQRLLSESGCSL